jgi:glutaredoxin 3
MRYALIIITVGFVSLGSYYFLNSRDAPQFQASEEATFPTCEMKVLMYMSPYCKYCAAAMKLLDQMHIPYDSIDVSDSLEKRKAMIAKTGRTSVPQIYIDEHHVGGYDDLKGLKDTGKLNKFLKTCDLEALM